MGASIYGNVGGVSHKGKELYVKVNGVNRKIKKEYAKVNGVIRQVYSGLPTSTYQISHNDDKYWNNFQASVTTDKKILVEFGSSSEGASVSIYFSLNAAFTLLKLTLHIQVENFTVYGEGSKAFYIRPFTNKIWGKPELDVYGNEKTNVSKSITGEYADGIYFSAGEKIDLGLNMTLGIKGNLSSTPVKICTWAVLDTAEYGEINFLI